MKSRANPARQIGSLHSATSSPYGLKGDNAGDWAGLGVFVSIIYISQNKRYRIGRECLRGCRRFCCSHPVRWLPIGWLPPLLDRSICKSVASFQSCEIICGGVDKDAGIKSKAPGARLLRRPCPFSDRKRSVVYKYANGSRSVKTLPCESGRPAG